MNRTVKVKGLLSLLLIASSLLLWQGDLFAQVTGKIRGVVEDAETGEPLPGANVIIEGTSLGATSDDEGVYIIINILPGRHTVRASMIGYTTISQTDVLVQGGRTITVDFSLKPAVLEAAEITVVAKREVVPLDVSATEVITEGRVILEIPSVKEVEEFLNMQPGVEDMVIRGGGQNQIAMVVDGIMMVDERVNKPALSSINLSAIQEISVITGGFNAEYGNIRSGMINVTTKEGGKGYHGSIDYRYSPPAKKHFGPSWYSPDSYYLRAYMDPEVAFEGTNKWDEYTQKQNKQFVGWNEMAKRYAEDKDPSNDMTAQEAQELFKFRKFAEGGRRPRKDGDKPDQVVDIGFGGPLPLVNNFMGGLNFFLSHRFAKTMYPYQLSRDHYWEDNTTLKIISNITPSLKLAVIGGYGRIKAVANGNEGGYYKSAAEALAVATSYSGATIYTSSRYSQFSLWRNSLGMVLTHVLGSSTFYNLVIDRMQSEYRSDRLAMRDTTRAYQFGPTKVDEAPLGWWHDSIEAQDGMRMGMHLGVNRDTSEVTTTNFKVDITSQVDRHNQIKAGIHVVHNDLNIWHGQRTEGIPVTYWDNSYRKQPWRFSAYVQDKLEVEGMIANIGVRADYSTPNTDWYTVEPYSKFYTEKYKDDFEEVAPKEPAKGRFRLSPRLGVSHPVSANSKVYFNYGHFYSMPRTTLYYGLERRFPGRISFLGNPGADWERTIAYELGYDHNLFDMILVHLAGYYKDVTNQAGSVYYHNVDGTVDYRTIENNNYADIRGFEISVEKSIGRWILGWANYNYMVRTSGYIGRRHYYEDPIESRLSGLQSPYQQRSRTQPSFRANAMFITPSEWGPKIGGFAPLGGFRLSVFYNWRAGNWFTYNPNNAPGIEDNMQWVNYSNWNARITKDFTTKALDFSLFMDVTNLFNQKRFNGYAGFDGASDIEDYMESLHLPKSPAYGNPEGNDKMGTVRTDKRNYVDIPNVENAALLPPRDIFFGLRITLY